MGEIQSEVDKHLSKVYDICTMPDADCVALEGPEISAANKSDIMKVRHDCVIAIRTIDKPNLHRLRELAYSTLLILGHMCFI